MKYVAFTLLLLVTNASAQLTHYVGAGSFVTYTDAYLVNDSKFISDPIHVVNPYVFWEASRNRFSGSAGLSMWRDKWADKRRQDLNYSGVTVSAQTSDIVRSVVRSIGMPVSFSFDFYRDRLFEMGIKADAVIRIPYQNYLMFPSVSTSSTSFEVKDSIYSSAPIDRSPGFLIGAAAYVNLPLLIKPELSIGYFYDATGFRHNIPAADALYDGAYLNFSLSYRLTGKPSKQVAPSNR